MGFCYDLTIFYCGGGAAEIWGQRKLGGSQNLLWRGNLEGQLRNFKGISNFQISKLSNL